MCSCEIKPGEGFTLGEDTNSSTPEPDLNPNEDLGDYKLLESEDFETGWGNAYNWASQHSERVSGNAASGNYSLRVARNPAVVDPLINLTGSTIYAPNYISQIDPYLYKKMKWVVWFKYDDYRANGNLSDTTYDGKLMYVLGAANTPDTADSFFVAGGGTSGATSFAYNGGAPALNWHTRDYGWKKSYGDRPSLEVSTGVTYGTDGKWHKFTLELDYYNSGNGYHRGRISIDDIAAKSNNYISGIDSDGWFNLPPEIRFKGMRLSYTKTEHIAGCRDKTTDPGVLQGYCSAITWDNIQVYGIK